MSFSIQIVDPRSDTEPSGWRDFRRRARLHPVWDYELLRLESWMARNPPVLAVIRDRSNRIAGSCAVMVCRNWKGQKYARPPTSRRFPLRPQWAEVYLPLLSGYPACVFHDEVDPAGRRSALRRFERELARYLGPGVLGVIYRAMPEDIASVLTGPGRMLREIDPTAVLRNEWDSPDDWLRCLLPEVRRAIENVAADGSIEVTTGAARADLDPGELTELLNEHRARQDDRAWRSGQRSRVAGLHLDTRSPVPRGYLDALIRRKDVLTRVYRNGDGALLAFNTMLDHPASPAVHHWAAVPASRGRPGPLHADAYAHCVRRMIEADRPELTAGRTLLETKAAFGFGTRKLVSVAVARPVMGR